MFNPSRDQSRNFLFETWRKYRAQLALEDMEKIALEMILRHPEYHDILSDPARYADKDYSPEAGETNPFLHLSLHMTIEEQLSINQPPGIAERYQRLLKKTGDAHDAQHAVMECLAEMIWQVQRHRTPFDAETYLACLDKQCK